ncbi:MULTISPECIES: tail completion protein gp17 [Bacillus amyloliquefaciens group]|uniref:tail completion protein gp17 n=1 Tax=Bacillus amyloliquefaciens group TaxID=1938374 RepID=UPI00039777DB|nr:MULTISPECIES: DUF3168 domain-containing protein [Bacillus amyloliquefaciens group]ERH55292.1 hypothetical protein O205_21275 [Bacillus amyloliquefaciens EGD-AQ14]MDH3087205.1 DUF3168 domain-containing protein [Bacillus velezensis]MEC0405728.1 DUF3168 domain-containing protein [Bacillus velezensis]WEY80385.1 DUF3168 domain-containing protein [Bacillus velezensis]
MNVADRSAKLNKKVYEALINDTALLNLVKKESIFEDSVPRETQAKPPYVVYQEISYLPVKYGDGQPLMDSAVYQIDAYDSSYSPEDIVSAFVDIMNHLDFQATTLIKEKLENESLNRRGYRFEANILL